MFITFEGPDGAGKSSQIEKLIARLAAEGYQPVVTREPGGTAVGDRIRDVVHDVRHAEMSPSAEVLLYSASRAQLVNEIIRPALAKGEIVLCDRYADSTLAYQGYGRGLDLEALQNLTEFATGGLTPDLTILLDIDGPAGLARRVEFGEEMNRLDLEALDFHERVRAGYLQLVAGDPARWVVIDAARSPEEVAEDVQTSVLTHLQKSAEIAV